MIDRIAEYAYVVGCLGLEGNATGFMLPIVVSPDESDTYMVQEIDEYLGTVAAFRPIEINAIQIVTVTNGPLVRRGGGIVYAFCMGDGRPQFGTLDHLTPTLRQFVKEYPQSFAINLQIAELIGTEDERRYARTRMRGLISQSVGAAAARAFYDKSAIRSALWERLVARAPTAAVARQLLDARSKIDVVRGLDGTVRLDLSALDPLDLSTIDIVALAAELRSEFQELTVPPRRDGGLFDERGRPSVADLLGPREIEIGDAVLADILAVERHEERISILIKHIIEEPRIGFYILEQYKYDRALHATAFLNVLRSLLFRPPTLSDTSISAPRGADVVSAAVKHFKATLPANRDSLLFYLSKHLSKHSAIRAVLRTHSLTGPFVVEN